jgi:hypothetical protein
MEMRNSKQDLMLRGNMGLCPIDMSLVNNCGVPSLWINPQEYSRGGSKLSFSDSKGRKRQVQIPFIKPLQRKLARKHAKVYQLLRYHRVFENEKYYGKRIYEYYVTQAFQDYFFFTTDFLKDKFKQKQPEQNTFANQPNSQAYLLHLKDRPSVLQLITGATDIFQPEVSVMIEPE